MEDVKIIKISELLKRGLPLTGAFSFHGSSRSCPISSMPSRSRVSLTSSRPNDSDSSPKFLSSLDHPAIIIGTLILPDGVVNGVSALNLTNRCPYKSCFQFTDCSAIICCDILHFDIRMIGKDIRVLSWNFIPLRDGGGLLEIIKWSFPDSSAGLSGFPDTDSFPLDLGSSSCLKDPYNAQYSFLGALESVSPLSTVPCTYVRLRTDENARSSCGSENLRGFFVQVLVCKCNACTSKEPGMILRHASAKHGSHSFVTPEFVYFCGFASSWHPVITKLIGSFVTFSGFKRKKVFISKKESCLMYVTAEKSTLSLSRLSKKWLNLRKMAIKGKGECGSYAGVIKGVYMHGMLVELDSEVWLLLTDQSLAPPHSLRVGSVISVKNVHFVNPQFSWAKILVLGACVKTSISVESFSPLETKYHVISQSTSMLGKFIGSLPFAKRLWALLIVSSFRKMFDGILSEKEILGSKHKKGLAQIYANSHIPLSVRWSQHGVLMEFNEHRSRQCGSEPCGSHLKSVIPISSFISFCEITWTRAMHLDYGSGRVGEYNQLRSNTKENCQIISKTYQSEDIGFTLVGSLKISPYSGRLQLVDATGGIDILVPDLPSTMNVNSIIEVTKYSLVVEGIPFLVDDSGLVDDKLFSCRNLFHCISSAKNLKLAVYVHFHYEDASCRSLPLYFNVDRKDRFDIPERGRYHLLQITHKFPVSQNLQGGLRTSIMSNLFIEAVIFSCNLILGRDDLTELSVDQLMENRITQNCEDSTNKRCKYNYASSIGNSSGSTDDFGDCGCGFSDCVDSVSREYQKFCNLSNHKISCFATVRSLNNDQGISGFLINRRGNVSTDRCMPSARRVLLEFKPDNFFSYQYLQMGNYYILKRHREDCLSNLEDSGHDSHLKYLISSHMHLWGILFATDGGLYKTISSQSTWNDVSFGSTEALSKDKTKLCIRPSVVCLHFSANIKNLLDTTVQDLDVSSKIVLRSKVIDYDSQCHGSGCLFPEGNLLSLEGHVVAVHNVGLSSTDADINCPGLIDGNFNRFFQRLRCNSCIHLSVNNGIVKIIGSTYKHPFPIGLRPGASASFHRILDLRGGKKLMLTPVSYIVINHIGVSNERNINTRVCNKRDIENCAKTKSDSGNIVSICPFPTGLISELFHRANTNLQPIKLNCRVVAVRILVLEKARNYVVPHSRISPWPPFHIPLAAFMLDDGSSTCCCWSSGKQVETLLRLHELLPLRAFGRSGWAFNRTGINNKSCTTASDHLDRVLRNHDRIVVRSVGSMLRSSSHNIDLCVSSDSSLSIADEFLIKFIILNVCHGSIWTFIASLMDSEAVRCLMEEHNVQMEMTRSMPSIWAREISCTNTLAEARNIMVELLERNQ